MLERALKVIPLGSQTFSKSITQYPRGVSPLFLQKGKGSRVTDVDGNEYIDFVNGLLCVTLGYCDADVDAAVRAQMENGVSFTLPHPLEVDVAESLVRLIPCADAVRFGKNGSDTTSAAIRLARAFTGREHVAVCGYHGWHDWYIGSTSRDLGVPAAVKALTHGFEYNNLPSLEALFDAHPQQIAGVIMEPMNVAFPEPGYLEAVKALCAEHGAVLVFDETVTGFRFGLGGAQGYFGVTPDLATFGKGLANGYPLSAIVGRSDIMKLMEEIFFSGTFGGETLSLAAASAVLAKMENEPVVETLTNLGNQLVEGVNAQLRQHQMDSTISLSGHPAWTFLTFNDIGENSGWTIKTLFLQECFRRGILTIGTHNLSYAHSAADIERLIEVYGEVFSIINDALSTDSLIEHLECEPLVPLFKVR